MRGFEKKKRIQFDLSEQDYETLLSIMRGRTLSEVLRHALRAESYLATKQEAVILYRVGNEEKRFPRERG